MADGMMVARARCVHGAVRAAVMIREGERLEEWVVEVMDWAEMLEKVSLEEARRTAIGCRECERIRSLETRVDRYDRVKHLSKIRRDDAA